MIAYNIFAALCFAYNVCYIVHCIKTRRAVASIGGVLLAAAVAAVSILTVANNG